MPKRPFSPGCSDTNNTPNTDTSLHNIPYDEASPHSQPPPATKIPWTSKTNRFLGQDFTTHHGVFTQLPSRRPHRTDQLSSPATHARARAIQAHHNAIPALLHPHPTRVEVDDAKANAAATATANSTVAALLNDYGAIHLSSWKDLLPKDLHSDEDMYISCITKGVCKIHHPTDLTGWKGGLPGIPRGQEEQAEIQRGATRWVFTREYDVIDADDETELNQEYEDVEQILDFKDDSDDEDDGMGDALITESTLLREEVSHLRADRDGWVSNFLDLEEGSSEKIRSLMRENGELRRKLARAVG